MWSPESGSGSVLETVQGASSQPEPLIMPEDVNKVGEGHGVDEVEAMPKPVEPQATVSVVSSASGSVSESD